MQKTISQSYNATAIAVSVGLSHLLLEMSQNFLPVIYPRLIEQMGLTYSRIGTLALLIGIFGALTQPLFGLWSDRWDARWIVVLSIAWIGLFMGIVGFIDQYWLLAVVVSLGSLGSAAYHPAGASLASAVGKEIRGRAMSIFSVCGSLGATLSPILISLTLIWFDLRGTAVLLLIGFAGAFFLYTQFTPHPQLAAGGNEPASTALPRQRGAWLPIILVIVYAAARSWVQGSLTTYLPEWLESGGRSIEAAGFLLSLLFVGVAVGGLAGGTLSDYIGRVTIVIVSMAALPPLLWLFFNTTGLLQTTFLFLIGLMIGNTFPVAILMAQEAWPSAVGLAASLVIGLGWLPAGLGSWVVGRIADQTSLTLALSTLTFVPLIGLGAAVVFRWQVKP